MSMQTILAAPGSRALRAALLAFALPLLAPASSPAQDERPTEVPYDTPGRVPLLSPDYQKTSHEVVLITDDRLSPRLVHLDNGQLVAWISYSRAPSTVVFEREVAKSMICHSLVNFYLKDDELRSGEIHAGEFASFCELKPGRYRYKVVRQPEEGGRGALTQLEGEIIVAEAAAEPGEEPGEGE